MEFRTPVLEAKAKDTPLLYGLDSMEEKNGVLEMSPKGRFLTFPGPGGYQITWAPGAIRIPLEVTPSGHLAFTLDNYGTLQTTKGGIAKEEVVLHNSEEMRAPNQSPTIATSSGLDHDHSAERCTPAQPRRVHWQ